MDGSVGADVAVQRRCDEEDEADEGPEFIRDQADAIGMSGIGGVGWGVHPFRSIS